MTTNDTTTTDTTATVIDMTDRIVSGESTLAEEVANLPAADAPAEGAKPRKSRSRARQAKDVAASPVGDAEFLAKAAAAATPPAEGTPVDQVATPTEEVVPPKPARTPAVRVERATTEHGAPPAGYLVLKATPSFDQFRKADATAEGPDWLTRCNAHGETTSADNRKAGRTLGSAAARASWCSGCKADARKAKADAAKAERAAAKNTPATADASAPADATADADKADAAADASAEHDAAAKSE
jgi:hypothetical protein